MTNHIQNAIAAIASQTDKQFFVVTLVEEAIGRKVSFEELGKAIKALGYHIENKVVSGHAFQLQYREKYNQQAEENIPNIYFGPGGFESYCVGGGCAYAINKG